jgi:hypothetical protein
MTDHELRVRVEGSATWEQHGPERSWGFTEIKDLDLTSNPDPRCICGQSFDTLEDAEQHLEEDRHS